MTKLGININKIEEFVNGLVNMDFSKRETVLCVLNEFENMFANDIRITYNVIAICHLPKALLDPNESHEMINKYLLRKVMTIKNTYNLDLVVWKFY